MNLLNMLNMTRVFLPPTLLLIMMLHGALAIIAHRDQLNLTTFNKYLYDDQGGKGVTAYVIDTGINTQHIDFGGRASWGKTIPINDTDSDGNGHGTHCSGTVGGSKFGVAKNVSIVAVKVLNSNGSGDMSDVIKGVEWTVRSHLDAVSQNKKEFKGSVANMSLGGGQSTALDTAVNVAVLAGVHFAVAAGNNNADACKYSPAAAADAVTVGASDISDTRASFSNFGKCVDILDPELISSQPTLDLSMHYPLFRVRPWPPHMLLVFLRTIFPLYHPATLSTPSVLL